MNSLILAAAALLAGTAIAQVDSSPKTPATPPPGDAASPPLPTSPVPPGAPGVAMPPAPPLGDTMSTRRDGSAGTMTDQSRVPATGGRPGAQRQTPPPGGWTGTAGPSGELTGTGPMAADGNAAMARRAGGDYPRCTREIRDNCRQDERRARDRPSRR